MIHLTNDAVQKKSEDYGRFESGNKVSLIHCGTKYGRLSPAFLSFSDHAVSLVTFPYLTSHLRNLCGPIKWKADSKIL